MEVQSLQSHFAIIPLDVVSEIGKHLDIKSITRFGSTKRKIRQFLNNPQQIQTYRTIYFEQYKENEHINMESNVNWAQLCRMHCYNRLKGFSVVVPDQPQIKVDLDYLTNTVRYENNYRGGTSDYRAIVAELPLQPLFCNGTVGYYELTVKGYWTNKGYITFGLTFGGHAPSGKAVGWAADTFWIGWHGDDGKVFDSYDNPYGGFSYGPRWMSHLNKTVTVGCLINFRNCKIAYTLEGEAFEELNRNLTKDRIEALHPIVALREDMEFKFNFGGEPFLFDVNAYDVYNSSVVTTDTLFVEDDDI
jgi:hypothetical protein